MIYSKMSTMFKIVSLTLLAGLTMSLGSCSDSSSSIIPVTEIAVRGAGGATTIVVDEGTLQMYATVTPEDASDKQVTWSVTNGTGEATISSSGLLTAVADGNVVVKAASAAITTINGTLLITISNQAATTKEALISAIASATDNQATVTESNYGSDVWPDALWVTPAVMATYVEAISDAQEVVDNSHATQLEVNDEIIALQNATTTFNQHKVSGIRIANKESLNSAIDSAEINSNATIVSVDGSDVLPAYQWVTLGVHNTYVAAIAAAQTVADNTTVKQVPVDEALATLVIATTIFNDEKQDGTLVVAPSVRVELGSAENFTVLAKSAVSTTGTTMVTGDVAVSPAAGSYITGFSETMDSSNNFATSDYVLGHILAADYAEPTPTILTTAISDMENAYTTGSGLAADATELFSGDLSGQTMTPGIYRWGNNVLINDNLTLNGDSNSVWIFQISGTLTQAAGIQITLAGGANPANIFWLVADSVSIGTGAHSEGIIIGVTDIAMGTNSTIDGRLYSQTAITLDATTVVHPS